MQKSMTAKHRAKRAECQRRAEELLAEGKTKTQALIVLEKEGFNERMAWAVLSPEPMFEKAKKVESPPEFLQEWLAET